MEKTLSDDKCEPESHLCQAVPPTGVLSGAGMMEGTPTAVHVSIPGTCT